MSDIQSMHPPVLQYLEFLGAMWPPGQRLLQIKKSATEAECLLSSRLRFRDEVTSVVGTGHPLHGLLQAEECPS